MPPFRSTTLPTAISIPDPTPSPSNAKPLPPRTIRTTPSLSLLPLLPLNAFEGDLTPLLLLPPLPLPTPTQTLLLTLSLSSIESKSSLSAPPPPPLSPTRETTALPPLPPTLDGPTVDDPQVSKRGRTIDRRRRGTIITLLPRQIDLLELSGELDRGRGVLLRLRRPLQLRWRSIQHQLRTRPQHQEHRWK